MSWKKVKLGDFLKHRNIRFKPVDEEILGLKRVDKIDFSGRLFLSDKGTKTDMILVKQGDLLISGINVEKGAMCVYEGEEDIIATIHYSAYQFDPEKIDIAFLKYYLKSAEFRQALKEQVPGGIKTEIKPKHLLPLVIEIPTEISDQQEIVCRLKEQEEKITLLVNEFTHQLSLLKKLRQSLLQDAVQGRLVAQDASEEPASVLLEKIKAEKEQLIAEKKLKKSKPLPPIKEADIPFELPEGWVWCRFSEIAEIESNLVSPFEFPEHPHVAPDNIEKGTGRLLAVKTVLDDEVKSANHLFFKGQLIYSKVRPKLNKAVIVDFEGLCSADMYPIRAFVSSPYLLKCMLSAYFLNEVDKFDNRVKMPKINQNQLNQIPIPLPPLSEQHRIVEKLESLLAQCDALEAQVLESRKAAEDLLQVALKEALAAPVDILVDEV